MSDQEEKKPVHKFTTGNRFWLARSSHGRNPIFANPQDLFTACCEYFQWVEDNPLISAEPVKFQGGGDTFEVPRMRAMTIRGLCIFLDISPQTWLNYKERPDFLDIVTKVEDIIYTQKFEGASAEMLNPNIIARDLKLKETTETEISGHIKKEWTVTIVDPPERK